ncbi:MAG: glycosyltransferase family 2 protein [Planctomycetes bacterium]|nr:glycosyltransferase family 2 protein [Planctomycetota bacterium]
MDRALPGRIGIVIVNWNSGPLLRGCLESILACHGLDRVSQVVVVDNDSRDGSCDDLMQTAVPVSVIRNDSNCGFAFACNQGAAACVIHDSHVDYLLFLNPDSKLHANSLIGPLALLDAPEHQHVGICGIQLLDDDGNVARSCSRLPTCYSLISMALRLNRWSQRFFPPHFMKEWDHSETRIVDQVIGAFFLVRRSLFAQLGGFDSDFFMYFEEVDFCERSRACGYQTIFLATAQAVHSGGGCSKNDRGRALFYSLRSRTQYARKHLSGWQAALVWLATCFCEPPIRMGGAAVRLKWKHLRALTNGFRALWWDQLSTWRTGFRLVRRHPKSTRNRRDGRLIGTEMSGRKAGAPIAQ